MSGIPDSFPISLRAWPSSKNADATSLPTLFHRMNTERGGLLNLTEETLRQEIAEDDDTNMEGVEESEQDNEDEDKDKPDKMKELMDAKLEILRELESAFQSSAIAQDFVSLLLSKDTPVQAGLSMSEGLKKEVPTGTLGSDKINAPQIEKHRRDDNIRVVKGWKVQNLDKTVDAILNSAKRLEKEIENETKYWEEVIAISDKGWAVCRLPNERHTLAVRFGFSEASLNFKNQSLAALRRNGDGSISLDQGFAGSEPRAIQVRIRSKGVDTGSSIIPKLADDDASVEALILQARNTIFASELWQELNRESRTLGGLDVKAVDDLLILPLSSEKQIVVNLVPLGDFSHILPGRDDQIAQGLYLSLQLLLSLAHRKNHRRRTAPPPPLSGQKRPNLPYDLLRPITTRLNHQRSVGTLNKLFSDLVSILTSASLTPKSTLAHSSAQFSQGVNLSNAERTIISLTDRLESTLTLTITPTTTITVTSLTLSSPVAGSMFTIAVNPESPLTTLAPHTNYLFNVATVEEYILYATSIVLASHQTSSLYASPSEETPTSAPGSSGWHLISQPHILRKAFEGGKGKQLIFNVNRSGSTHTLRLRVGWGWARHDPYGTSPRSEMQDAETRIPGEGVYEWKARGFKGWDDDDGLGEVVKSLEEVVEQAGRWVEV